MEHSELTDDELLKLAQKDYLMLVTSQYEPHREAAMTRLKELQAEAVRRKLKDAYK